MINIALTFPDAEERLVVHFYHNHCRSAAPCVGGLPAGALKSVDLVE